MLENLFLRFVTSKILSNLGQKAFSQYIDSQRAKDPITIVVAIEAFNQFVEAYKRLFRAVTEVSLLTNLRDARDCTEIFSQLENEFDKAWATYREKGGIAESIRMAASLGAKFNYFVADTVIPHAAKLGTCRPECQPEFSKYLFPYWVERGGSGPTPPFNCSPKKNDEEAIFKELGRARIYTGIIEQLISEIKKIQEAKKK